MYAPLASYAWRRSWVDVAGLYGDASYKPASQFPIAEELTSKQSLRWMERQARGSWRLFRHTDHASDRWMDRSELADLDNCSI